MRIAFDATGILGPMSRNRGIGNYSMGQFSEMIKRDRDNEYFFFNLFDVDFSLKETVAESGNLEEFKLYMGENNFLFRMENEEIIRKIIQKFLRKNKIEVFCFTSPFDSFNIRYQLEWFEGVKTVAIVYDIIPFIFKKRYLPDKGSKDWYMKCVNFIRSVDRIQVISQSVKDDLVHYLDFSAEKIDVIWGAVDKRYRVLGVSREEKERLYNKFEIKGDFVMCTGGDDERKNIAGLIEAYGRMASGIREKYQLVIVCKLSPASIERYRELSKKTGCEGQVVLTGFVSDEELLLLYNLASIMAFPSQYEGFGLPVVEAWACGTPVLTSNNSSLVQIAGDGAIVVDPFDVDQIAKGLEYALTKCDLNVLLEKGREQLRKFQWENVADASIASINLLKSGIKKELDSTEKERKIIAFFTPLPPLQSGISDYSVDIIKELSKYFDMDIYVDDGYEPDVNFTGSVCVQNHKKYKKNHEKYADTIYQIGNSEFHMYMFSYVKDYPGTVVLHDYNLHGIVIHTCFASRHKDYSRFRSILLEDYDKRSADEYIDKLKHGQSGYRIYDMPLNGFITNYAKKMIVHSNEAKRKLLEKNIGRRVFRIWHYAKVEELNTGGKFRENLGYGPNDCILAAFGHIHETKRAMPILRAFRELVKENDNLQLLFVGKLSENLKDEFEKFVETEQLTEHVKVTGYIELEDFVRYIELTDICLNLRYPYNGETSGSLMRIFARGKCVIVNDIGSFGEFPDEICVKIPSVETMDEAIEVEQIYNAIKGLLSDTEKRTRLENNAYRFAKENLDMHIIGKKYAGAINCETMEHINEDDVTIISNELQKMKTCEEEIDRISETLLYLM